MEISEVSGLIQKQGDQMQVAFKAMNERMDEHEKKYDGYNLDVIKKMEKEVLDLQESKQRTDRILAAKGSQQNMLEESETKGLFAQFMRKGENRLSGDDLKRFDAWNKKSLSVNIDPDGGFTVTPEISAKITTRIFESSPMRSVASVITISSDSVDMMLDDDEAATGGWTAEKGTVTETATPEWGMINIPVHEQFSEPKATQKILDDSAIDIESWLAGKTSRRMLRFENTAFASGDGSGKPRGFLDYDNWTTPSTGTARGVYQRDALETINSGTDAVFDADTLIRTQAALIEEYQSNAVWLGNRHTIGELKQLKDGESRYRLLELSTGGDMLLLGKRIIFANDMPTIATDAKVLAYGDFEAGYQIVDRMGIRVLRDPFTAKPFIKFYTTKRVGGAVISYEAIKRYQLSA